MSKTIYGRELRDLAPGTRVKVVDTGSRLTNETIGRTGSRLTNETIGRTGIIAPGAPMDPNAVIPAAQQQGVTLDRRVPSRGWVPVISVELL